MRGPFLQGINPNSHILHVTDIAAMYMPEWSAVTYSIFRCISCMLPRVASAPV